MPSSLSMLFPGSHWPDYQGGSLLNLMASLSRELGGPHTGHAGLHQPWLSGITRHQHVVLILIDGLGEQQLRTLGPDSMLYRHQLTTLSSVFPATTAAAITTLLTGHTPASHGLIGWHLYCQAREAGQESIVAPLPMSVRHPAVSTRTPEQLARQLLVCPPLLPQLGRKAEILQPHYIADSPYSLHHAGNIKRTAYRDVEDAFAQLATSLQQDQAPGFHYLYLPQLDSLMHRQGCHSRPVQALFTQLDAAFTQLADIADQTDSAILLTADHGFIDTPRARQISLDEDFPALYTMLNQPLSGERRAVFCHVKPGLRDAFISLARQQLGHACWVVDSRQLLEAGAFGPGNIHPQLASRCGDVTLLAQDDWSIRDTLPQEKPLHLPGQHGGVSAAEMYVPLILRLPQKE
ncbi:alkaline phosphatase family protein [Aquitalea sp.]|uniref:alkaline phosphatase family protein n=1 Tax=Aquitalea sp. TaxID=1872623 RepID=UPI00258E9862|nr:alkaline phosphatase family protein [Aquitalea sp.]